MRTFLSLAILVFFIGLSTCVVARGTNQKGAKGVFSVLRMPVYHVISVGISQYNINGTTSNFPSANDVNRLASSIRESYWATKLYDLRHIILPKKGAYTEEKLKTFDKYKSHGDVKYDSLL